MIETVTYKECTCDLCGEKKQIITNLDMPKGWTYLRYLNPKSRNIVTMHLCEPCGENVVFMIEGMVGGKK